MPFSASRIDLLHWPGNLPDLDSEANLE